MSRTLVRKFRNPLQTDSFKYYHTDKYICKLYLSLLMIQIKNKIKTIFKKELYIVQRNFFLKCVLK